jgi:hypothetical protein
MSNIAKKIQRQKAVEVRKDTEKKMAKQMNMFDRIPDKCDVCSLPFDRKSKEMAQTWVVVVRSEQNLVRLFCPGCIDKTKEYLINEDTETELN